ncbi:Thiosulfate sulfurtransferase [Nitrosotalea devaniterrae]|uniref:Sulfurtransferase n=1 Tax=Nitrosotalea devaniterrae TaxID=1078905 RepID=A0A128A1E0_9ARCH|nr:Thiosulfate sulfurtransferase [Candidatus Nitrosotalea devanaterra]
MNYAQQVLVDTETVANNLGKSLKVVEVDYDPENAYRAGHLQGASLIWWKRDINDPITRDIISKSQFEDLLSRNGITPQSEVVLYGDFNNWFAAFVFWIFKYYGHENVKIMNGGRKKWEIENRSYTKDEPQIPKTNYVAQPPNEGLRAYLFDVRRALDKKDTVLVDVRSPKEFSGEITAPAEYPMEHAQRGGHIPNANNIPWASAVNDTDGTFKSVEDLKKIYETKGVTPDKDVICYCRIGERSSHTWFVLKYLLGYPQVRNYDGSWTEWGNMIGNPIEK